MSEMVRRAAKAICAKRGRGVSLCASCDNDTECRGLAYIGDAREVILAMREPTDRMLAAGTGYILPLTMWRPMIDAALAEL